VDQPGTSPAVTKILVMKLDKATGNVLWKKLLGSAEGSLSSSGLFKTIDGKYLLTGNLSSPPSISDPFGSWEILLVKIDPASGTVQLAKTFGSNTPGESAVAGNLLLNADGSLVLTGNILAMDMSDYSMKSSVLAMKLASNMSIVWQKDLDGGNGIFAYISKTGSNVLLTGITGSLTDSVPGDVLYAKLNSTTYAPAWARTFGAAGDEWGVLTKTGTNYLLSGGSESFGGAIAGKANIFGIVLDANGNYPNCNVKPFVLTVGNPGLAISPITLTQATSFTLAQRTPGAPSAITLTKKTPALQVKNICTAIPGPQEGSLEESLEEELNLQQDAE